MKRSLLALAFVLVVGATPALAAGPVAFSVTVTVRQAITITKTADLDFGTVEAAAATYTVAANGGAQTGAGPTATPAQFTVTGEAAATANVVLGTNPVTVTCAACGGTTLTVNLTTSGNTVTFPGGPVFVGGSVTTTGTTASGIYTGASDISLIYQ